MAVFTETLELEDKISGPAQDAMGAMSGLDDSLAEATGGLSILAKGAGLAALAIGALVLGGAALAVHFAETEKQLTSTFDALGHGQISGAQTVAMLDQLGHSIGQTREQLAPLTQSFMAMGITGVDQLRSLTLAAAGANATIKGSGDIFVSTFKKLTVAADLGQPFKLAAKGAGSLLSMGLSVDDMAKRMGVSATALGAKLKVGLDPATARKFGDAMQTALIEQGKGPLDALANSTDQIKARFIENIGKMFKDVGPVASKFMGTVRDLFDIFDDAKPSGAAMQAGIGGFFKGLFAIATKVVPYVKHFFLDLVIYGLKAYITMKPLIKQFSALFATSGESSGLMGVIDFIAKGLIYGVAAAASLTMKIVLLGAWIADLGGKVSDVVGKAIAFFGTLKDAIVGVFTGGNTIASDFVDGLIKGIMGGVGKVIDAASNLGKSALGGIKGALGISSPSKEMALLGGHSAAGMAQGLDEGRDDVHGAASGLATATMKGAKDGAPGAPGAAGAAGKGGSGGAGGGGEVHVLVEAGAIVIQGGSGQGVAELHEEAVQLVWERIALAAGL